MKPVWIGARRILGAINPWVMLAIWVGSNLFFAWCEAGVHAR